MWSWYLDNSLWVLIISAVVVIVLLIFGERIRNAFVGKVKEKKREAASRRIGVIFWSLEGLLAAIMVMSLITMLMSRNGSAPIVSVADIKKWILDHGVPIIIILVVGIVLWASLKKFLPPLVNNVMARPVQGESREGRKRRGNTLVRLFVGLGRVIIGLMVVLMVLSELNISVGPILAGFGIVGVAVGFGAQYLIRDLIAGVFILLENQYRVGDVVNVAGTSGLVEEINLRKTVLRDLDGIVHHVPNGEIRVASNYSRHFSRVNLNISVAYKTDLDFAIKVINHVCREVAEEEKWKKVFKSVPSVLRVDNLGDSGIEIKITADVQPLEQWNATGELRLRLKNAFDKEGIEIPFPHTTVFFGNKPGD
ncbi:MAG: mechanosensitive ion channel family protein [Dehalococcoidales bacterium]|jgi:small conductance mechanosensitive channel